MKQTVVILTALMMALLLITGFVTAENVQLDKLIGDQTKLMEEKQAAASALEKTQERLLQEAQHSAQTIRTLTDERDALSRQLADAVLSSQEANDAASVQEQKAMRLVQENARLQAAYEEAEAQLMLLQEEAAQTALAFEQQTMEDAQRMEQLQAELEKALTPTPEPTSPERTPVVRHLMVAVP